MTAPALSRQNAPGRRYLWPPPPAKAELIVPSVTTILGNLAKPALVNWAAKEVATFAVENIDAWAALPTADALDLLKRAPYRNMTKKGNVGTAVHAAIDAWNGGEPTIDPDLLPYVSAAISFLDDQAEELIVSEVTIFNRTYMYAGTCDCIVKLKDGRTAIVDWKSGKAIYPEVALQLSGYANGEFIATIGKPTETVELVFEEHYWERPMPPIDLGVVVHLPGDGTYTAREIELTPRLWRTFQALRTIQKWKDDFEADVLGKTHRGKFTAENVVDIEARRKK